MEIAITAGVAERKRESLQFNRKNNLVKGFFSIYIKDG